MVKEANVFRGGIRWGGINVTWPFVKLIINKENILLKTPLNEWLFDKEKKSIEKYSGLFSKGIRIQHSIREYPQFVVFWTFTPQKVITAIEAL